MGNVRLEKKEILGEHKLKMIKNCSFGKTNKWFLDIKLSVL